MILLPQLKGCPPPLQAPRQQRSGDGESEQAQEQQTKEKDEELPKALKNPLLWMKLCPNSQM
jgi:hypothetical protein